MTDVVGVWNIPLNDKVHEVEFEHGALSGKRVIRLNKKEIMRKDYMFKLVGSETFFIDTTKCVISIDLHDEFIYKYSLEVNGIKLQRFTETQTRILSIWNWSAITTLPFRIVLEKDTMDVWINGRRVETMGEFVDDGTETHFIIGDNNAACIKTVSSGKRRTGLVRTLFVNGIEIPPSYD